MPTEFEKVLAQLKNVPQPHKRLFGGTPQDVFRSSCPIKFGVYSDFFEKVKKGLK
jgi:hypothetical protein